MGEFIWAVVLALAFIIGGTLGVGFGDKFAGERFVEDCSKNGLTIIDNNGVRCGVFIHDGRLIQG